MCVPSLPDWELFFSINIFPAPSTGLQELGADMRQSRWVKQKCLIARQDNTGLQQSRLLEELCDLS